MSKKIVITFPGGRGYEIPLLYFGSKHFEDMGYEKLFINHPGYEEYSLDTLLENAWRMIEKIDFTQYEEIVFVAKSIGTLVACKIKEQYKIPASLILFTPLEGTLPYISHENDILLVASGEKDRYLDASILKEVCLKENVACYIEPGVGHRMEVMNDLDRNLEVIYNVIGKLE